MRKLASIAAVVVLGCFLGLAQDGTVNSGSQGPGNVQTQPGPRGPRVAGTITTIEENRITLKTLDGRTVEVTTSPETQFRRDRQAAKLSDFKVGDEIFVGGELKDGVVQARLVGSHPTGAPPEFRDALGKRFIVGEVKAITGTRITILRPDGVTQNITVDESTSFRKEQESVTLADVQVGDHVFGRGEMKKDVFVPTELSVGEPPFMGRPPAEGPEPQ